MGNGSHSKNYIIYLAAIFAFLISFNRAAYAIDFDARDTRVDLPVLSTPNNALSPSMSADNNGHVYIAWSDNRGGASGIYTNTFFPGRGWNSRSVPITTGFPRPRDAQEGDATSPQICADNSGHVYVGWVDDRAVLAGTGKLDIYFRYSKDYGTTWYPEFTDERIDTDNPAIGRSEQLRMSCDDKGNVYFVWEDDRTKAGRPEIFFRSLLIKFNKPSDFIEYYQTPDVRINTGQEAGKYTANSPAISSDNKNNVYISWLDNREKPEDKIYRGIYTNYSPNNGTSSSWNQSAIRIDSAPISGHLKYSAPVMGSDSNGNVYVAWIDDAGRPTRGNEYAPDGTTDVYFNHSNDFGVIWGKEDQRIEMPNYGDHQAIVKEVAIANNNKGVVVVAWTDDRFGSNNIFTNHSENFGRSFLDTDYNIRNDTGVQDPGKANATSPVVKVDEQGTVFALWGDTRLGISDLFFNFSSEKGKQDSWQESDYLIDYPEPPGNSYLPLMAIDNQGHFYIAWLDTRSALAKDNYNIYFLGGFFDIQTLQIEGQRLGQACFIATAAYGSPFEYHVELLRRFRDQYLVTNSTGKTFVGLYYRFSPRAANYILKHSYLKPVVRIALAPAIGLAAFFVYTSFQQKVIVIMLIMFGIGYLVLKGVCRKKQEVRT